LKNALITGVSGQDGSYLAKYLLDLNYTVYGAVRRSSNINYERFNFFSLLTHKNFFLIELDLTDLHSIQSFFRDQIVDEVYNLAAQSFVGLSFSQPHLTTQVNSLGTLNLLESIRNFSKKDVRYYQASTSEMFGMVQETPQNENTKFYPRSPYGISKLFAHWITINYRESYDMFNVSGILFNHESPLRGHEFVTRKITNTVAKIVKGKTNKLVLGNLNANRDWGFAGDYVKVMHLMLQHSKPEDFVIATNVTSSVRDFVTIAFNAVDIDIYFDGTEKNEKGIDRKTGNILVEVSDQYYRPAEVDLLLGDSSKAEKLLRWKPSTPLNDLVKMMVNYDLSII